MTAWNVVLLAAYALGMSAGQILFKLAADRVNTTTGSRLFILGLVGNVYFVAAVLLYGLMTVLWVWILTRVPLTKAYPFVVLAFVFTPALAAFLFGERFGSWYVVSILLIVSGLGLLLWKHQ